MVATTSSLASLTANDLMSRDLVLIPAQMSLRAAARTLSKSHISGAPVVDRDGRCIGVLSTTNFLHSVEKGEQPHPAEPVYHSAWQIPEPEDLPADRVEAHMTRDPVTAPPGASIIRLARMMLDAHVHRIIIVDRADKPIGIVSSTDILAAVAREDHHP
jgi:predicted transcriptional regulator